MSIEHNGRDIVVNGDILPASDYYPDIEENRMSEDEIALKEAGEAREKEIRGTTDVPPEVIDALHGAALSEDRMRSFGASKDRIETQVYIPLGQKLTRLALRGCDIKNAYPTKSD